MAELVVGGVAYGLHSAHGFFPAWIASSLVAYFTRFLSEIFIADLQSGLWKTWEFWRPRSHQTGCCC